jgi:protein-arginine kinase
MKTDENGTMHDADEMFAQMKGNEIVLNRDWPSGRALFYNQDMSLFIKVNGLDHLEINFTMENTSIPMVIKEFYQLLDKLDRECDFAYDDDLGYLTSRPYNLGHTNLKVRVDLKGLSIEK